MSIKIYDGLRAVGRSDIFDAADEIRAVLNKTFFTEMDHALEILGDDAPKDHYATYHLILELDRQKALTFDPFNIAYRATLLRGRDWPLVIVDGEKSSRYTAALIASGVAEPYGYWDNSEPENGQAQTQWDLRRDDWGRALSRPGLPDFDLAPIEAGLTISWPGIWPIYQHWAKKTQ